jgi:hypothetical protein
VLNDVVKSLALGRSVLRRVIDQRPRLIAFIAAAVSLAVGAGLTFRRATTPWSVLPDYDYWPNITGLITEKGAVLDLARLFQRNNEHIVVIPKLIYLANYLLTSGSNIGLIVYSISAGAACAILLLVLARDLLRDTPARWALCGVLFPLAMFSAKLSHSYYFGMSGAIWLTADIFVILSAASMARAAQMESTAWLLASLLAALLGVLTYSTAVYSLLALLVFCAVLLFAPKLRGRIPWPVLLGVAAVTLVVLAVWLIYRPHPGGHPPLDFDPLGLAGFVLIYLGAALSEGYLAPVTGLAIIASGAIAIRRLLAEGRGLDILLWVTLFLFAPFNALMTGIGRLGFGLKAAFSSRYQSVTAISLMAVIVLVLAALPKENVSRGSRWVKAAALGALGLMAVFFVANSKSAKFYAKHLEKKPVVEIALRLGIAGDHHLAEVRPSIEKLYRIIPALIATRHVPFNTRTRCEDFMGLHLASTSGEAAGAIDNMATYTISHETRTAIELSGWAVQAGKPAECIAVVDGDGVVVGAGVAAAMHLEPMTQRSLRIGWQAVAYAPQSLPVCAFALFPDASAWSLLANCQSGPR